MNAQKDISDIKLAVCCLARDCARLMKSNIVRINGLQKYCKELVVFVVENDSTDNTRALLERWQRNASFQIYLPNIYEYKKTLPDIDIDFSSDKEMSGPPMYKTRVSRISFARDCYLDALEKSGFVPDYVVMCDIDIYHFSIQDIIRTISQRDLLEAPRNLLEGAGFPRDCCTPRESTEHPPRRIAVHLAGLLNTPRRIAVHLAGLLNTPRIAKSRNGMPYLQTVLIFMFQTLGWKNYTMIVLPLNY